MPTTHYNDEDIIMSRGEDEDVFVDEDSIVMPDLMPKLLTTNSNFNSISTIGSSFNSKIIGNKFISESSENETPKSSISKQKKTLKPKNGPAQKLRKDKRA